jgi:hypothetical protein
MSWKENQSKKRNGISENSNPEKTSVINGAPGPLEQAWELLLSGFEQDVEEFERLGGQSMLQKPTDLQCRISNSTAGVAVLVTADLSARTVEYSYESEKEMTAVPEKGILTLRSSGPTVDFYSSDQRLTSEQARQLILEPLLFPTAPTEGASKAQ